MPKVSKRMKLENVISTYNESSDEEDSKKGYRLQQKRQELDSAILKQQKQQEEKQKRKLTPDELERLEEERKKEADKKKRQKKILRAKRKRENQLFAAKPSTTASTATTNTNNKPSEVYKRQNYTVSVALPGSILRRDQSEELKAHICYQLARTLALYRVDEVIIYNEEAKELDMKNFLPNVKARPPRKQTRNEEEEGEEEVGEGGYGGYGYYEGEDEENGGYQESEKYDQTEKEDGESENRQFRKRILSDHNVFLANLLYYLDTPIYLRSKLFPHVKLFTSMNNDSGADLELPSLESAYHLLPLEFPHAYREGITVDQPRDCAYIGREKLVRLDQQGIPSGLRVTVETYSEDKFEYKGRVVSSLVPKEKEGLFWGYNVRLANSLSQVFSECGYGDEGYDLTASIGDSNTGLSVDQANFSLPSFKHLLLVFGGSEGLDRAIENDKKIVHGTDVMSLVDIVVNPVPHQGVRTIHGMEGIGLTLGALRAHIDYNVAPIIETTSPRKFSFIKQ